MVITTAVLWDLDGVIIDSTAFHYQAYRRLLNERGRDLDEDYFSRSLFGIRNEEILRTLLGPELGAADIAALARRKEETYRSLARGKLEPLPGVRALAERLAAARVAQAIVSSTPRENILLALEATRLRDSFSAIISGEDVQRGKPDPQPFLLAAAGVAAPPAQCVVIEDAPPGIQASRAAGMRCIGVTNTRPAPALEEAGADLIVASLEDARVSGFLGL